MMDPVPGRPISSNPGLKSLFRFCILPSYVFLRATFCVIITERYFEVKSQQYSLYKLELHHGGGGGTPLHKPLECVSPMGRAFSSFRSENGYRLFLVWSGFWNLMF